MINALPFTLIIPAHNEETVIARCLQTALAGVTVEESFEIIVVANGCDDRTVDVAREAAPHAKVLDLPVGSKTAAINAANRLATYFPRIVLDADVECNYHSLSALADILRQPGVMTAAPTIRLHQEHCNFLVKAYYAAWMRQPYARSGKGGAGCYGISQSAMEHIGEFPPIIGDDIWIHTRFPDEAKRMVEHDAQGRPVFSIVRPPSTAWQQVKVEARRMRGNAEVMREHPSPHLSQVGQAGGLRGALYSGASPFNLCVFFCIKGLVRLESRLSQLRSGTKVWTRDTSSREV